MGLYGDNEQENENHHICFRVRVLGFGWFLGLGVSWFRA